MEITFTLNLNGCRQCPFCHYVSIQGFCGYCCEHPQGNCYALVPERGFREDCPCKENGYTPKH
jgi:hypothetical protein